MSARSVVVLSDYFLPGFKAGGPIRSLEALSVAGLEGSVHILTGDRDLGDRSPYPGVTIKEWLPAGSARVMYLPSRRPTSIARAWWEIVRCRPTCLYLNTLFGPWSGLLPIVLWKCKLLGPGRLVIAPRGQLDVGALTLSARKKRLVLRMLNQLRLVRRVRWHATSLGEAQRVRAVFGAGADVVVLAPEPAPTFRSQLPARPHEPLRLVFVSRISPKKGLLVAIEAVGRLTSPSRLDVYGAEEDEDYVRQCRAAASALPRRHWVHFHGPLEHAQVSAVLEDSDVFLLPTLGENFGHAIFEALAAGCPVVVGDATPWSAALASGAGIAVDPRDPAEVARAVETLTASSASEWRVRSDAAVKAATQRRQVSTAGSAGWQALFWADAPVPP